jgi:magnesium transporter
VDKRFVAQKTIAGQPIKQITPAQFHDPILPYVRPPVILLRPDDTMASVLATIRNLPSLASIHYFYVVDDKNRLVGVVPLRRLLTGPDERRVKEVMDTKVIAIPHSVTVLVASEFFADKDLLAFPVVDEKGHFLGVVDVVLFTREVIELARKAYEDIFQLVGVHGTAQRSPWAAFRDRFPWLLCNVVGGLLAALISGLFEPLLGAVVVLALFIPVVLALGESVGMQVVSLTLQGLTDGPIVVTRLVKTLWTEMRTALLLGAGCGLLVGGAAFLWKGAFYVGVVTGGAIVLSVAAAGIVGVLVPTTLRAISADPRIAAGPVVLATADMVTLFVYFGLGTRLLM